MEQTYSNYEIILVNDGSIDNSGIICERYARMDDRINVIHQPSEGVVLARRQGISKARGDFIIFLDSDDYWDKDLLETVYKAIIDSNCDMVIFNYKKVSPDGITYLKPLFEHGTVFDYENKIQLFEELLQGSRLNNLWNKAFQRNLIDVKNYLKYIKIRKSSDLLQSLPLLYRAKRILYLDKALYNYRMNPKGITLCFQVQSIKDITVVRGLVLKYMKLLEINDKKHLVMFYQYYVEGVLSYLLALNHSGLSISKKIRIMEKIQKFRLYKNSLSYVNISRFSCVNKIRFLLFQKKYYLLMAMYDKGIWMINQLMKKF